MKSAVFLALLALVSFAALVQASSHGEAPGVLANPPSDATDLYAFVSYEPGREKYVTILALYNPLQQPIAGPNFFPLSNDYFYEILVDTTGDGVEEYLFTFDVSSELEDDGGLKVKVGPKGKSRKISVPLKVIGQIDASKDDFSNVLNYRDTYTLSVTNKKKKSTKRVKEAGSKNTIFAIPFDNAGEKTIPNYSSYARKYVYDIDLPFCNKDGKVFVGQRQEPFFIALGETFDLVNYQGNKLPLAGAPGGVINSKANNDIAGFNIDVLALEIPIKCLGDNDVIGVWTRTRSKSTGRQNQRLGNPLVNELVIGLEDKDKWNKVTPKDDNIFKEYFEYPAIAELLDILFAAAAGAPRIAPTNFPRKDISIPLQKGLPGLNRLTDGRQADMLRLNTSIPPTPQYSQNNLGVAGGDLAGFPNGRRPGDDIVDITLRVVMGVLCHTAFGPALDCGPSDAPTGTLAFSDGADGDASDFQGRFPYLNDPLPGARIF